MNVLRDFHEESLAEGFGRYPRIPFSSACDSSGSGYRGRIPLRELDSPNFVEDHLRAAKQGVFLAGSRINIKDTFRDALFATQRIQYPLGFHGLRNKTRRIYWPFLGRFYRPKNNFSKQFRGCNTSFWRDDFIRINGYNEAFEGWGREDSDLAYRLLHLGCSLQRLKHRGLLYHIPHQTLAKDRLAHNDALEQKTITEKIVRATKGLDQYAVKATGDTSNTI